MDVYSPKLRRSGRFTGGTIGGLFREVATKANSFANSPLGYSLRSGDKRAILESGSKVISKILKGKTAKRALKSTANYLRSKLQNKGKRAFKRKIFGSLKKKKKRGKYIGGLTLYKLNKRKKRRKGLTLYKLKQGKKDKSKKRKIKRKNRKRKTQTLYKLRKRRNSKKKKRKRKNTNKSLTISIRKRGKFNLKNFLKKKKKFQKKFDKKFKKNLKKGKISKKLSKTVFDL